MNVCRFNGISIVLAVITASSVRVCGISEQTFFRGENPMHEIRLQGFSDRSTLFACPPYACTDAFMPLCALPIHAAAQHNVFFPLHHPEQNACLTRHHGQIVNALPSPALQRLPALNQDKNVVIQRRSPQHVGRLPVLGTESATGDLMRLRGGQEVLLCARMHVSLCVCVHQDVCVCLKKSEEWVGRMSIVCLCARTRVSYVHLCTCMYAHACALVHACIHMWNFSSLGTWICTWICFFN